MPEELKTPKDRQITAPVHPEALVNVYQGHQILFIRTPWGWIYQRDDGVPFATLKEAQTRPVSVEAKEPEPATVVESAKLTEEPPEL